MTDSDDNDKESESQNPMVVVGIFMALGFEVGGGVFAGYYLGGWFDAYFGTAPSGMIVGMLVALAGVGYHFYTVARQIQNKRLS